MDKVTVIGNYLLWSLVAGCGGAAVMLLVLTAFTKSGLVKIRLLVALGSLITRRYEKATLVGGIMHMTFGMLFGLVYTYIMVVARHPGVGPNMLLGAVVGMLHGLFMSMMLVGSVAEVHPLPEFQERGYIIAVSHWVAHVAYGMTVGALIGVSGLVTLN